MKRRRERTWGGKVSVYGAEVHSSQGGKNVKRYAQTTAHAPGARSGTRPSGTRPSGPRPSGTRPGEAPLGALRRPNDGGLA